MYNASRLKSIDEVALRIAELSADEREKQERQASGKAMSPEEVLKQLGDVAETSNNDNARVRALELLGKAAGIEGFTTTNVRHLKNPAEMSSSELRQIVEQARQQGYLKQPGATAGADEPPLDDEQKPKVQ